MSSLAASVLLDGYADLAYHYAIPAFLEPRLVVGSRVEVSLRGKPVTGTVLALEEPEEAWKGKLVPIARLLEEKPVLSAELLELGKWVAQYYMAPFESVMRCLLPSPVRRENTSEKTQKRVFLEQTLTSEELQKLEKRAPKQAGILALLRRTQEQSLLLSELGGSEQLACVRALEKKGILRVEEEATLRNPDAGVHFVLSLAKELNAEQQEALKSLKLAYEKRSEARPFLLEGVTGSGKTEVYLQLVDYVLACGQSALILVPEISLTPQTVQRFKSRFGSEGNSVAVLHSLLSDGERYDEWRRIQQGQARIVIGARSAVFAPLENLGLIVVDEEHDGSYKQENNPRYHGRDMAVLRAQKEGALVLLGSATPSLESYHNVRQGKYQLLTMKKRVDDQSLPVIRLIDMKLEAKKNDKSGATIISDRLYAGLLQRLERGEQSILFLNRRGFARSLQCPDCGHVIFCPHCALALTYHRAEERLICHLCGYQALAPKQCPECQSFAVAFQGYGTQKVEEVLSKLFPQARIGRLDADISKKKNAVRHLLSQFEQHKIDILLGTQMIAKGLDFPKVTLVGVLNADLGLHVPDFRASERTFQLLTQVAGRAGRGDLEGEVIIQTFTPHAPAIQYARHNDTEGFNEQEWEMRSVLDLPPFSSMLLVTCRGEKENLTLFSLQTLHRKLLERLKEKSLSDLVMVTDVLPAAVTRAHGQYRFQMTLKTRRMKAVKHLLLSLLEEIKLPKEVTCVLDVDPRSFM